MDFSSFMEFLQQFETKKIMEYLQKSDTKQIMEHPYFLTGLGIGALVAYFMKWRLLLVVVIAVTGFIYLLNYTLAQGTSLDGGIPTESLAILVGGGCFIVFLAIYLLFIKSE